MSVSTYTELQTAVQTWLDRTDLSSVAADFITLAESRLNRVLSSSRLNLVDGSLTGSTSSRSVALPTGFVEPIALFLTTFGVRTMLAPKVAGTFEYGTTSGVPSAWCINGSNIDLDVPCDQAHTFSFRYRKKLDIASDTTNWLLT